MPQPSPFSPALFDFFRELKENNEKAWFEANRERYESVVVEPCTVFVLAMRPHLREISRHIQAEPRIRGGSLFRIHANRRFNPDRPPYKEQTGVQFRHTGGQDVHAPGFYLHLEPTGPAGPGPSGQGGCFAGMGCWRPDREGLTAIREAIVEDPEGWRTVAHDAGFQAELELGGESLKLGPRGFDRDHPLIDDIKRTDYVAVAPLSEEEVTADGFVERFAGLCRAGTPFMAWLCRSLDVPF